MCVVTKSLRKREDAPTVYLAVDVDATKCRDVQIRPSQGFRKQAFISGKWKQKPHFEENGEPTGNIHVLGNREQVSPWEGLIYKTFGPTERGMCSILMRHPILCK